MQISMLCLDGKEKAHTRINVKNVTETLQRAFWKDEIEKYFAEESCKYNALGMLFIDLIYFWLVLWYFARQYIVVSW